MEDPLSVDTTSNFSSIAEAPEHLDRQYAPLTEVFHTHSAELPQRGSADSNSEAMIGALKALQDKIHSLELERVAAADKFRHLAHETQQQVRGAKRAGLGEGGSPLQPSSLTSPLPGYPSSPSPEQEDLKARLEAIDAKFTLQARELEHMRERLQHAESGHHKALMRGRLLEEQQRELMEEQRWRKVDSTSHTQSGVTPTLSREAERKLRRLEQEHAQMTTVHSLTESKVKDLEGLLMEEQRQRKRIQDRTAKLQTAAEMNRILLERAASDQAKKMPVKKRKKTPRTVHTCMCGAQYGTAIVCKCKPVPGVHYRMSMKDVPFVVGTSVTPSHSVGANYQNVLALMKTHSPLLCGAAAATRGRKATVQRRRPSSVSHAELKSLLAGLEEELGRLTFKHQELAKQIQEQTDPAHPQATSGLERQLELLVEHLETKAEQIKIVRKQLLIRRQRSHTKSRLHQATASLPVPRDGEVEVTTTVKAKGSPQGQAYSTADCKTPSLEFLKKMKSLQNTLQRDDLSWD